MTDKPRHRQAFHHGVLGKADLAAADATAHPDIRGITGLKPMGPIEGLDEYKGILVGFVDAFPAEVACRDHRSVRVRRRDAGRDPFPLAPAPCQDYYGIAATNRRVILFDETHVARLAGGKIIENIVSATNLEFEMLMAPVLSPMILK